MDDIQFNKKLDSELLASGVVTRELYLQLADAYGYGAASTVGWVEAKLLVLSKRLTSGDPLSLYYPHEDRAVACTSVKELQSWTSAHFPGVEVHRV